MVPRVEVNRGPDGGDYGDGDGDRGWAWRRRQAQGHSRGGRCWGFGRGFRVGHALGKVEGQVCGGVAAAGGSPGEALGRLSRTQQLVCAGDEAVGQAGLAGKMWGEDWGAGGIVSGDDGLRDGCERAVLCEEYRKDREGADMELFRRILPFATAALLGRRYGVWGGRAAERLPFDVRGERDGDWVGDGCN